MLFSGGGGYFLEYLLQINIERPCQRISHIVVTISFWCEYTSLKRKMQLNASKGIYQTTINHIIAFTQLRISSCVITLSLVIAAHRNFRLVRDFFFYSVVLLKIKYISLIQSVIRSHINSKLLIILCAFDPSVVNSGPHYLHLFKHIFTEVSIAIWKSVLKMKKRCVFEHY